MIATFVMIRANRRESLDDGTSGFTDRNPMLALLYLNSNRESLKIMTREVLFDANLGSSDSKKK